MSGSERMNSKKKKMCDHWSFFFIKLGKVYHLGRISTWEGFQPGKDCKYNVEK